MKIITRNNLLVIGRNKIIYLYRRSFKYILAQFISWLGNQIFTKCTLEHFYHLKNVKLIFPSLLSDSFGKVSETNEKYFRTL